MTLGIIKPSDFADALMRAFQEHDQANLEYLMTEFNIADHGVTKKQKLKFALGFDHCANLPKQKKTPPTKHRLKTAPILFWLASLSATELLAAQSETKTDARPTSSLLEEQNLGLFPAKDFYLTTGKCTDCPTPKQARWYFENDLIAVPKNGLPMARLAAKHDGYDAVVRALKNHSSEKPLHHPTAVWIGSTDLVEHAFLSADGNKLMTSDGSRMSLNLVPKIATNRSYFDHSSVAFFRRRPLRVRGALNREQATPNLTARTIWPEDFRIHMDGLTQQPLLSGENLSQLITTDSAKESFETRSLWETTELKNRFSWANLPVLALVLSGGQGDDDESQAGHVAVATGRVGARGEMADWLVNNFYNLDEVSEKGIIASMLPLDNYLADLNSGQSYYRPVYMLVAVLKDRRAASRFQQAIQPVYNHLYRHDFLYHHSKVNCTGISIDALRALGWQIPRTGPTGYLKAAAAFAYLSVTDRSFASGKKMFDYLSEEQTRLFPRAAFQAAGEDLLGILNRRVERQWTDYERALRDDVAAILFIRIPQIPSSRAFGTYPIASFEEYRNRVPADRSQWKIVPVAARPFPNHLKELLPNESRVSGWTYTAILIALLGVSARWIFRGRFARGKFLLNY